MDKFFVVINEAVPGSWPDFFWSDVKDRAEILLDNTILKSKILRKIRKLHFSNKANRKLFLPFKNIWDKSNSLSLDALSVQDNNFIIFQSAVKFSPLYISRLKKKGAKIILYLPDTVEKLGLGDSAVALRRYEKYYHIDKTYSFDPHDCKMYDIVFFDIYSSLSYEMSSPEGKGVFYIGNCRTEKRLQTLNQIYDRLSEKINCDFRIVGVSDPSKVHKGIECNHPLSYKEVLDCISGTDCILEIMNEDQQGSTLRGKEAICFNKKLLTNNPDIVNNQYYDPQYIHFFSKVEEIDLNWLDREIKVDYGYRGEYSPRAFFQRLVSDFR